MSSALAAALALALAALVALVALVARTVPGSSGAGLVACAPMGTRRLLLLVVPL